MSNVISVNKANHLLRIFREGKINIRQTARQLGISRNTVKSYLKKFKKTIETNPFLVSNMVNNRLIITSKDGIRNESELSDFFESIKSKYRNYSSLKELWRTYSFNYPNGIKYSSFIIRFKIWRQKNTAECKVIRRCCVLEISDADLIILNKWKRSGLRREWELSVVILESFKGLSISELANRIGRCKDKIRDWINLYKAKGIEGFSAAARNSNEQILENISEKKGNLIKLLHETPKLHGINRTSWSQKDLVAVFEKVYGSKISTSTISAYLKKEGYVYRKARQVLTSPDPEFRQKLNHVKGILSKLSSKEKFFSIDEYGPFAVKIKGGKSLVKKNEFKTFPQVQKSKGFTICTAALELSCNQISHFYSTKKNTDEMVKLINLLIKEYKGQDKLYLSWDAASWHSSKQLIKFIDEINSAEYQKMNSTPLVELVPLPSSAQFLNVIESVFSGLAKSIIHNSDYKSLDECKEAINQYFKDRNKHFFENPKKAGNQIWGQEIIKPVFNEVNNSKNPRYR